jgi:MFS transporter, DHA2 family, multidrug resistance protein
MPKMPLTRRQENSISWGLRGGPDGRKSPPTVTVKTAAYAQSSPGGPYDEEKIMDTSDRAGTLAGRREWAALALLALPTMLTTLDISVLFLALPKLTADLRPSATQQLWISDIYGFLIAGFLVTMGTLGDRVGRRRVLLAGGAAFGVLSLVAAYSAAPQMLIASRALLGVAGATILPSTLALVNGMFRDPKQLGTAIGVWASALAGGVAVGPIVGGLLLRGFWWGSVFLISLPVMALLLAAGPRLLPEFKAPAAGRLDPASVVLSLAAILPFIYGLKELAMSGWQAQWVATTLAGLAFGVVFGLRQRRLSSPLLDLRLFAIPAVGGALALGLLNASLQGGSEFFVSQYLQSVKGLTPLSAGLWLLVPTFALLAGIMVSQGLAQKARPAYIIAAGMAVAAMGMVVLTQVGTTASLAVVIAGITIVYAGASPVGPLISQLIVPAAPPEKAGSASALQSTSGELGIALGIALLGSIGSAVYRGHITIPAQIAGTTAGHNAHETVAGALSAAAQLPASVADALITSARNAFTSGLNTATAVCAIAFAGLTVLAIVTLRHIAPLGMPDQNLPGADAQPARDTATATARAGTTATLITTQLSRDPSLESHLQ